MTRKEEYECGVRPLSLDRFVLRRGVANDTITLRQVLNSFNKEKPVVLLLQALRVCSL